MGSSLPIGAQSTTDATQVQSERSGNISSSIDILDCIADRYELQSLLATGGMGVVYRAWDRLFKRTVAVKIIHEHLSDEHHCNRFRQESLISAQLQHPNIPPVYDLGSYGNNRPYLVMKLVKGRTLDEHIHNPGNDTPNLIAVFESVCQALGYAHSHGVLHRDLKPTNIMVGAHGEVQVMDWGLAKLRHEIDELKMKLSTSSMFFDPRSTSDSHTHTGSVMGTPSYMPPEQAIGAVDKIDERSDVFGLGGILCAILTHMPVFVCVNAESARQQSAKGRVEDAFSRLDASCAEPELIALAKRCLAVEPEDRPANGLAVAAEVARIRTEASERAKMAEIAKSSMMASLERTKKALDILDRTYTGIMKDHPELLKTGNWKIVGEQLRRGMESLLDEARQSNTLDSRLWETQIRSGHIAMNLNNPSDAEHAFRAALALACHQADANPRNLDCLLNVGISMRSIGAAKWQLRQLRDAADYHLEAIKIIETVIGVDTEDSEFHHEHLTTCIIDLGKTLESQEKYLDAIAWYEKAFAISERFLFREGSWQTWNDALKQSIVRCNKRIVKRTWLSFFK